MLVVDLLVLKRLVDLDGVDREAVEVGELRIAGAEIVDRQPHAQLAQSIQLSVAYGRLRMRCFR